MSKRIVFFIFLSTLVLFILSLLVYFFLKEDSQYSNFLFLLEKADEKEIEAFLVNVSNKNLMKYYLLSGIKDFYDGEEGLGISNLMIVITNETLSKRDIAVAKFLIGSYLLLEENRLEGIGFLTSSETIKYFSNYVYYIIGVYNFDKENYDEAMDFLLPITNFNNEEIKKDILLRISFIQLAKEGKLSKEIESQILKLDKNIIETILSN